MKVVSCEPGQMSVSPEQFNACTFNIIDKWDPKQHAKTCDTMFYLRDGTGAYVWDCDKWIFLDFTGYTAPDWNASENQQGYIKNKPFQTLGNGLTVSKEGVLSVNVTPKDIGAASTEELNEHINDTKNPHGVTAHQVGALTEEETYANVIYQLIGKENVKINITLDYQDKIAGSVVENPNWASFVANTEILNPEQFYADSYIDYPKLFKLDGAFQSTNNSHNTRRGQLLFKYDVLNSLKNELGENFFISSGANTSEQQIALVRKIVSSLEYRVWSSGSGVNSGSARNWVGMKVWLEGSGWSEDHKVNETNQIKELKISSETENKIKQYIDKDGCAYSVVYSDPSDGIKPTVLITDYACLEVTLDLSANEIIKSEIAAYHRGNPPEWTEVTEKPFETIGDNLEVVDGKLNASTVTVADQEEVNSGTVPDKYISPKTLSEWENEQLLKRGKQIVIGSNQQLEYPSDMNFGKFGISDNYKAGTFRDEQPYFTVDDAGDVVVKKAGQYIISGIVKKQYRRAASIWHYISFVHKDITSGSEVKLDTFPYGGTTQNRNKQYGYEVRQCKVGDKIWAHSDSSAKAGDANADALQYLNMEYFCMERLGD